MEVVSPYTPEQNGAMERKHHHVIETVVALLHIASMPVEFWGEAALTSIFLINQMPISVLQGQSPFQKLYCCSPDYAFLKVFGCCYPWLRPYASSKLEPKSTQCVFIGYQPNTKAYRCLNRSSGKVYISRFVQFRESNFPFAFPHSLFNVVVPEKPVLGFDPTLSILTQMHSISSSSLFPNGHFLSISQSFNRFPQGPSESSSSMSSPSHIPHILSKSPPSQADGLSIFTYLL